MRRERKRGEVRREKLGLGRKDKIFGKVGQAVRRKRRNRVGHAVARLTLILIDAVASITRSRNTIHATGARAASRSHNSLFKLLLVPNFKWRDRMGHAIAWANLCETHKGRTIPAQLSVRWILTPIYISRGRVGHAVARVVFSAIWCDRMGHAVVSCILFFF